MPRFAYGEAAFDHLEERGVGAVRRIMHPEGAKNLSHGEAAKIMEAVANSEEVKNFYGIPGLPLCEESDASTSELFSRVWIGRPGLGAWRIRRARARSGRPRRPSATTS